MLIELDNDGDSCIISKNNGEYITRAYTPFIWPQPKGFTSDDLENGEYYTTPEEVGHAVFKKYGILDNRR